MIRAGSLLRRTTRADLDSRRAQRVKQVLEIVDRFVYDLGQLIAGDAVDLAGYVAAGSASRLHDAIRPALNAGTMTRPDFGEYAQVRIEGDVLDVSKPVVTIVEFDDRSQRLDDDGFAAAHQRRRVRVRLLLDAGLSRVLDHSIEFVP